MISNSSSTVLILLSDASRLVFIVISTPPMPQILLTFKVFKSGVSIIHLQSIDWSKCVQVRKRIPYLLTKTLSSVILPLSNPYPRPAVCQKYTYCSVWDDVPSEFSFSQFLNRVFFFSMERFLIRYPPEPSCSVHKMRICPRRRYSSLRCSLVTFFLQNILSERWPWLALFMKFHLSCSSLNTSLIGLTWLYSFFFPRRKAFVGLSRFFNKVTLISSVTSSISVFVPGRRYRIALFTCVSASLLAISAVRILLVEVAACITSFTSLAIWPSLATAARDLCIVSVGLLFCSWCSVNFANYLFLFDLAFELVVWLFWNCSYILWRSQCRTIWHPSDWHDFSWF